MNDSNGKQDKKVFYELSQLYNEGTVKTSLFEEKLKLLSKTSKQVAIDIRNSGETTRKISTSFLDASKSADKMSLSSKAAAAGMKALSVASNILLSLGVAVAFNWIISEFTKLVNAQENAIATAQELTAEWENQRDTISGNINTLKGLQDEFDKLSRGVDDYGKNVSLSTEEYVRYKDIVQQILSISPSLITGYDEEGNAIANKNELLQISIDLQKESLRLERERATSPDNLWKVGKGNNAEYEKQEKALRKHRDSLYSITNEMVDPGFWGDNINFPMTF